MDLKWLLLPPNVYCQMKNPVIPKIFLLLIIVFLGSCSARKYMDTGSKSYEIGEYYQAI